ncbi:MAG: ROK family protein [Candidatus Margulisiibacteriota bacterium]
MKKLIAGVDLGGTKISAAVASADGKLLAIETIPTLAHLGVSKVTDRIAFAVKSACKKAGVTMKQIKCIGIGAPGPVDPKTGYVNNPPNLKGWKRVNLKKIMAKKLGKKIILENDANCAALAELNFGAGRRFNTFIYVTLSTGIGGGIVIDKKLYTGFSGSAGEVGHTVIDIDGPKCTCGKRGHLEGLAAGPAVEKRSKMSPEKLGALARKGNKKALKEIDYTGHLIGLGFSNIVNIMNPEAIIVGGGLTNLGKPLFEAIKTTVKENALAAVKIIPAHLKKNVGVIGAVALCL